MHSIISTHLCFHNRKSFINVYSVVSKFDLEQLLDNLEVVTNVLSSGRKLCDEMTKRANRVIKLIVALSQKKEEKHPQPEMIKNKYHIHDQRLLNQLFSEVKGYSIIRGGDSINKAYFNKNELVVVSYVEGEVTECKCSSISVFEQELERLEIFYKEEF
ncbi:hypothetical protein FWP33_08990 [Vibrio parahaemolyticus]|nr:hypothetical protein [Vibrio parahaemolyticus]ELA8176665.1 hypothetical protein [Vibrio alginolyticus]